MNAQLPKLKPRDVFFIVLGLCLLVLVLWYFTRFQARQQNIQELQSNLDTSSTQLSDLQTKQSQLPGLRADVRALEDKQDVFVRALPSTVRMGQVIRDIQDSVGAAGGKLDGVTVQGGTETNLPPGVQAVNLNVSLQGQFAPIFRTLRSVETMGRFSKVTSVNMTLPAPNATDPLLNGVVNMTVYTFDPSAAQPAPANPASGTTPGTPAPAAPAAPTTGGKS
ncbi:type 4a pilus biogenesis protein PilO [Deinococcus alpinitundrae]|uniref:type 4a pilus biogenesis protein PilO n=1 Tax=Deinococcus alpinitundrae TaxID=468913 RepID=UPI00137A4530|nr:type 4a pilus biogenesis protein PilO [Deinococcus alpinitundrae]